MSVACEGLTEQHKYFAQQNASQVPPRPPKGDTGETVKALQQLLLANNIDLDRYGVDGSFGAVTEAGVLDYQEKVGIATDGIVGEETMGKLLGLH